MDSVSEAPPRGDADVPTPRHPVQWRPLAVALALVATSVQQALAAIKAVNPHADLAHAFPRHTQAGLCLLCACVAALWALGSIFGSSRFQLHSSGFFTACSLCCNAISASLNFLPLSFGHDYTGSGEDLFLQRMWMVAALPLLAGQPVEDAAPLLLSLTLPLHLVLDACVQLRTSATIITTPTCSTLSPGCCLNLGHDATPNASPGVLSLVLWRMLPSVCGLLLLLLALSLAGDAPEEEQGMPLKRASEGRRSSHEEGSEQQEGGEQRRRESGNGSPWSRFRDAWLFAVRHMGEAVHGQRCKAHACGAAALVLWPLTMAVMVAQVLRASYGLCCSPVEGLLGLLLGLTLGTLETKSATQGLVSQLHAMTELANDLVPAHVVELLVRPLSFRHHEARRPPNLSSSGASITTSNAIRLSLDCSGGDSPRRTPSDRQSPPAASSRARGNAGDSTFLLKPPTSVSMSQLPAPGAAVGSGTALFSSLGLPLGGAVAGSGTVPSALGFPLGGPSYPPRTSVDALATRFKIHMNHGASESTLGVACLSGGLFPGLNRCLPSEQVPGSQARESTQDRQYTPRQWLIHDPPTDGGVGGGGMYDGIEDLMTAPQSDLATPATTSPTADAGGGNGGGGGGGVFCVSPTHHHGRDDPRAQLEPCEEDSAEGIYSTAANTCETCIIGGELALAVAVVAEEVVPKRKASAPASTAATIPAMRTAAASGTATTDPRSDASVEAVRWVVAPPPSLDDSSVPQLPLGLQAIQSLLEDVLCDGEGPVKPSAGSSGPGLYPKSPLGSAGVSVEGMAARVDSHRGTRGSLEVPRQYARGSMEVPRQYARRSVEVSRQYARGSLEVPRQYACGALRLPEGAAPLGTGTGTRTPRGADDPWRRISTTNSDGEVHLSSFSASGLLNFGGLVCDEGMLLLSCMGGPEEEDRRPVLLRRQHGVQSPVQSHSERHSAASNAPSIAASLAAAGLLSDEVVLLLSRLRGSREGRTPPSGTNSRRGSECSPEVQAPVSERGAGGTASGAAEPRPRRPSSLMVARWQASAALTSQQSIPISSGFTSRRRGSSSSPYATSAHARHDGYLFGSSPQSGSMRRITTGFSYADSVRLSSSATGRLNTRSSIGLPGSDTRGSDCFYTFPRYSNNSSNSHNSSGTGYTAGTAGTGTDAGSTSVGRGSSSRLLRRSSTLPSLYESANSRDMERLEQFNTCPSSQLMQHKAPMGRCSLDAGHTFVGHHAMLQQQQQQQDQQQPVALARGFSRRQVREMYLPPAAPQLLAFSHNAVTVLFADIVGFTTLSKSVQAFQVFEFLNELYARYDAVVAEHSVYKVETIGDCYMCATGLLRDDPNHAAQMVLFANEMQRQAAQVLMPDGSGCPVQIRVGIHSGPLLSGVIGRIRKRYCVVGSTVNLASRMESTGVPGRIQISSDTYSLVHHLPHWGWECRGEVEVKGVGPMITYLMKE